MRNLGSSGSRLFIKKNLVKPFEKKFLAERSKNSGRGARPVVWESFSETLSPCKAKDEILCVLFWKTLFKNSVFWQWCKSQTSYGTPSIYYPRMIELSAPACYGVKWQHSHSAKRAFCTSGKESEGHGNKWDLFYQIICLHKCTLA